MKDEIVALEHNVAAELEVQRQVQELLERQLELLQHGRTAELAGVLEAAEVSLARSARLEGERAALLARLGEALGVAPREVSLALLEERAGELAGPLVAQAQELKERLARVRETNRLVSLLLRHSVLFIDDLVALVASPGARARTYGRDGGLAKASGGTLAAEA